MSFDDAGHTESMGAKLGSTLNGGGATNEDFLTSLCSIIGLNGFWCKEFLLAHSFLILGIIHFFLDPRQQQSYKTLRYYSHLA